MLIRSIIIHRNSMHHHFAALPTQEEAELYATGNRAEEDLAYPEYQQYMELPAITSDDEGSYHEPDHYRGALAYPATPPSDSVPIAAEAVSPATRLYNYIQARHTRGAAGM
jgi:hypothetical protein